MTDTKTIIQLHSGFYLLVRFQRPISVVIEFLFLMTITFVQICFSLRTHDSDFYPDLALISGFSSSLGQLFCLRNKSVPKMISRSSSTDVATILQANNRRESLDVDQYSTKVCFSVFSSLLVGSDIVANSGSPLLTNLFLKSITTSISVRSSATSESGSFLQLIGNLKMHDITYVGFLPVQIFRSLESFRSVNLNNSFQ